MKNHLKIGDYGSLSSDYDALLKILEKIRKTPTQFGSAASDFEIPNIFVKAIAGLEDELEAVQNGGQKKLFTKNKAQVGGLSRVGVDVVVEFFQNVFVFGEVFSDTWFSPGGFEDKKSPPQAFNSLRAKVRKQNEQFVFQLTHYKENRADYSDSDADKDESESDDAGGKKSDSSDSDSDSDSSDDGSDADVKKKGGAKGGVKKKKKGSDAESGSSSGSDSDSSGSDSSDYSEPSETSEDSDMDEDAQRQRRRRRWLKTEADWEAEGREKDQKARLAELHAERVKKKQVGFVCCSRRDRVVYGRGQKKTLCRGGQKNVRNFYS